MKIPYGLIYLTSRVENGEVVKRYVGQHKLTGGVIEDGYLGSGKLLRRAIKKYGRECFSREVLQLCFSIKELNDAEVYWISHYGAADRDDFYNISPDAFNGGGANKKVYQYNIDGSFVREFSSMVEAATAVGGLSCHIGGAAASKIRFTACGFQWRFEKMANCGSRGVKERRKLQSNVKSVSKFTLDGIWVQTYPSFAQAAKEEGQINAGGIHACCSGRIGRLYDFMWRSGCSTDPIPPYAEPDSNKHRKMRVNKLCPETGSILETFESLAEGARSVLLRSTGGVHNAVRKGHLCKGFKWEYAD